MPFQLRNPSASGPVPPTSTPLQRIGSALAAPYVQVVQGVAASAVGAYRTWVGEQETVKMTLSDPYTGWKPLSDACAVKVGGKAIPDGVVMTHCQVRAPLEYRATPISEAVSYKSRFKLSTNMRGEVTFSVDTDSTGTSDQVQSVLDDARKIRAKYTSISQNKLEKLLNTVLADRLQAISDARDKNRLAKATAKFRKVHIGDVQPRVAELRFTVMDVLGDGSLLSSRHEILSNLYRMFCQNPSRESGILPSSELLSVAAKVTAEAVSGRLVKVSSKGLDPYHVETWACTSFVHREVPDTDLIFVQVVLTEYESIVKSDLPQTCPDPVQAAPAPVPVAADKPVRPAYGVTGKWSDLPSPEVALGPGR